jgi:glycosyltransferase 2 family protein
MVAKSRKWLLPALAAFLVGYLVFRSRHLLNLGDFSGEKLWQAVRGANPFYIIVSVVLIYLCYLLRAIRWRNFQKHIGTAKLWNIYGMTLAGFSAVFLLGRAGEPVRPLLISRKEKIPLADTFGIYALERLLDTGCTAVLAAIGLLIFTAREPGHPEVSQAFEAAAKTAGTALCLGVLFAIGMLVYLRLHGTSMLERRMPGWLAAHGWRAGVARILLGFSRGVQTIRTWSDLLAALVVSALHWLLVVAIYYLVPLGFQGKLATLNFQDAIVVLVFTLVGSAVQLPGVGGGSQALSILAYTSVFGIEKEPAVVVAMVLWLITFAACTFAGVPLLVREGWSIGELRRMSKQEDPELDAEMVRTNKEFGKSGGETSE